MSDGDLTQQLTYFRARADECARLRTSMAPEVAATPAGQGLAQHLRRHEGLWTQLADEIDDYQRGRQAEEASLF